MSGGGSVVVAVVVGDWVQAVDVGGVAGLFLDDAQVREGRGLVLWEVAVELARVGLFVEVESRLWRWLLPHCPLPLGPTFPRLPFTTCIIRGRYLQNLFDQQVVALQVLSLPIPKGGQFPEDDVEVLGVDPDPHHPCVLAPLLVPVLEVVADSAEEVVERALVGQVVEGLLRIVGAEEEIYLEVADCSLWVLGLRYVQAGGKGCHALRDGVQVVAPFRLFQDVLQEEQFEPVEHEFLGNGAQEPLQRKRQEGVFISFLHGVVGQNRHPVDDQSYLVVKLRLLVLETFLRVFLALRQGLFSPDWCQPVLHLWLKALEEVADAVGAVVVAASGGGPG